ncbi:MAG: class I SAM-dependent methyltransferase [Acidimicrobiia bacterium]
MSAFELALEDRLVESATGSLELLSIHLGRSLGLYAILREPNTAADLALEAGIDLRYAREWLEQQATADFITVDDPALLWGQRRYSLSERQVRVLLTPDDPIHVAPLADMIAAVAAVVPAVAAAYRRGSGVAYSDYGKAFRDGQAGINRPAFTHSLVQEWVPESVPAIHMRLNKGGLLADLGCGAGWSTVALTRGYPNSAVIGYDSDASSIEDAKRNALATGLEVDFRIADASQIAEDGPFDLILILEALHDMSNPVEVLAQARLALAPDGAVLVADEQVASSFTAPGDMLERMMYAWSVLACLPSARVETPSAATGTVLREPLLREMAQEAGFDSVELPDVDAGFFRLYVLR